MHKVYLVFEKTQSDNSIEVFATKAEAQLYIRHLIKHHYSNSATAYEWNKFPNGYWRKINTIEERISFEERTITHKFCK